MEDHSASWRHAHETHDDACGQIRRNGALKMLPSLLFSDPTQKHFSPVTSTVKSCTSPQFWDTIQPVDHMGVFQNSYRIKLVAYQNEVSARLGLFDKMEKQNSQCESKKKSQIGLAQSFRCGSFRDCDAASEEQGRKASELVLAASTREPCAQLNILDAGRKSLAVVSRDLNAQIALNSKRNEIEEKLTFATRSIAPWFNSKDGNELCRKVSQLVKSVNENPASKTDLQTLEQIGSLDSITLADSNLLKNLIANTNWSNSGYSKRLFDERKILEDKLSEIQQYIECVDGTETKKCSRNRLHQLMQEGPSLESGWPEDSFEAGFFPRLEKCLVVRGRVQKSMDELETTGTVIALTIPTMAIGAAFSGAAVSARIVAFSATRAAYVPEIYHACSGYAKTKVSSRPESAEDYLNPWSENKCEKFSSGATSVSQIVDTKYCASVVGAALGGELGGKLSTVSFGRLPKLWSRSGK